MNIKAYPDPHAPYGARWYAINTDIFDGAPDASTRARAVGVGETKQEAIADLMNQYPECPCPTSAVMTYGNGRKGCGLCGKSIES